MREPLLQTLRGTPRAGGLELVLEIVVALAAFSGGFAMMLVPDGSTLQLPSPGAVLGTSPFRDWFWPGVALTFGVGAFNAVAAVLVLKKSPLARAASFTAGAALAVFVTVEVVLTPLRDPLQVVCFALGALIAAIAVTRREGVS